MTKKVLFINPSQENIISLGRGWFFGVEDVGYYQPLGILYVATYLKNTVKNIDVRVIDAASPNLPYSVLEEKIKEYDPDVIGISTYTITFLDTLKVATIAKKLNPSVHINLGGHHLTHFAAETLAHGVIDSVIIGEGEISFAALVTQLSEKKPVESIPGVFTRNNRESIGQFNRAKRYHQNISTLPFPDRGFVGAHHYYNALTVTRKMTTIVSSRGCPYNCSFCPQAREPYRQRSARSVADEIAQCMATGYTDFFFSEDTFNISKKKVVSFCREIIGRRLSPRWCCKARIHGMDLETLRHMKAAGCYLINFGIETGTDFGLKQIRKGTTTEEIRNVIRWSKEAGIKTMSYFMIGHPFEKTAADVLKNIDFLLSLQSDYCHISVFTPIPHTAVFDEGVRRGILSYEPWKRFVLAGEAFTADNWAEHLSMSDLNRLKMKGIIRFYFRPGYILKQLLNTTGLKELAYKANVAVEMIRGFLATHIFM